MGGREKKGTEKRKGKKREFGLPTFHTLPLPMLKNAFAEYEITSRHQHIAATNSSINPSHSQVITTDTHSVMLQPILPRSPHPGLILYYFSITDLVASIQHVQNHHTYNACDSQSPTTHGQIYRIVHGV